jgi:hypothetical protein
VKHLDEPTQFKARLQSGQLVNQLKVNLRLGFLHKDQGTTCKEVIRRLAREVSLQAIAFTQGEEGLSSKVSKVELTHRAIDLVKPLRGAI